MDFINPDDKEDDINAMISDEMKKIKEGQKPPEQQNDINKYWGSSGRMIII